MSANYLQALASIIDQVLNPDQENKGTGFCLLVFGFNAPGISNYVSNANRADMIKALRETADRLEKNQDKVRFR